MDDNGSGSTDVFLSTWTDKGATWSAPLRVNDDGAGNFHFNQWLAVDPLTGAVDLSWNDTRNDPSQLSTDIFFGRSLDGGGRIENNLQVYTAPAHKPFRGADFSISYHNIHWILTYCVS